MVKRRCPSPLAGRLSATLLLLAACRDDGPPHIDFVEELPLYDEQDIDSEAVEVGSGATVALRTRADVDYRVIATGEVMGDTVVPVDGEIRLDGRFEIVPAVILDTATVTSNGPVDTIEHEFKTEVGEFDPFLVGESVTLTLAMPDDDVQRMPLADVPLVAVELVLDPAPGSFTVTFAGACFRQEGDAVQYTGRISIEPDVRYLTSIEIAIPFVGTEVLGPVEIPLDLPSLDDQFLDFGVYSISSRHALSGVAPCEGMDATMPATDDGGSSSGDGGSSSTG